MSKSETLQAFEDGLITQSEALEQACVDDLRSLHERAAIERINNVSATMRQVAHAPLGLRY